MLDTILKEVSTNAGELASTGWVEGMHPPGYTLMDKVLAGAPMYAPTAPRTGTMDADLKYRTFAFKLDKLGFFASQHYIPLEWVSVTLYGYLHHDIYSFLDSSDY
jgi:hypothetical protein